MAVTDTLETLEGLIAGRVRYHYDVRNDVLYLRRLEDQETQTVGEQVDDGAILLRDDATNEIVGVTIVDWWKQSGRGELPDSVTRIQEFMLPWAQKLPAYTSSPDTPFPKTAKRILLLLIEHLPSVEPGKPETYLGYKEVHDHLNLPRHRLTWGQSLQHHGLNDLAYWVRDNGLPAITGLIVDTTKERHPGQGYFEIYNRSPAETQWWHQQVAESKQFDWTPHLKKLGLRVPVSHVNA